MTNYEPGTVAVATVRGVPNVRVFRKEGAYPWVTATGVPDVGRSGNLHLDAEVTDVRPAVVLDLDDATDGEFLGMALDDLAESTDSRALRWVVDQIADQTRPPKPAEPTGLGAVVEARTSLADSQPSLADLQPWVRDDKGWLPCGGGYGQYRNAVAWSSLRDVRVLSEGVKP